MFKKILILSLGLFSFLCKCDTEVKFINKSEFPATIKWESESDNEQKGEIEIGSTPEIIKLKTPRGRSFRISGTVSGKGFADHQFQFINIPVVGTKEFIVKPVFAIEENK